LVLVVLVVRVELEQMDKTPFSLPLPHQAVVVVQV
jgi:hypothetical protein